MGTGIEGRRGETVRRLRGDAVARLSSSATTEQVAGLLLFRGPVITTPEVVS